MTTRVLVVDDDDDIRRYLESLLNLSQEFTVIGLADNGADAVRLSGETQPDFVLLDERMPAMNGTEALPKIRAVVPQATVVIFTAFPEDPSLEDCGADAVIDKTAPPLDLLAEMKKAVS